MCKPVLNPGKTGIVTSKGPRIYQTLLFVDQEIVGLFFVVLQKLCSGREDGSCSMIIMPCGFN